MSFMNVSGGEMRAAQTITGATMTAFVLIGIVPAVRPYAGRLRIGVAVAYIAAAIGFMIYLLVR